MKITKNIPAENHVRWWKETKETQCTDKELSTNKEVIKTVSLYIHIYHDSVSEYELWVFWLETQNSEMEYSVSTYTVGQGYLPWWVLPYKWV